MTRPKHDDAQSVSVIWITCEGRSRGGCWSGAARHQRTRIVPVIPDIQKVLKKIITVEINVWANFMGGQIPGLICQADAYITAYFTVPHSAWDSERVW